MYLYTFHDPACKNFGNNQSLMQNNTQNHNTLEADKSWPYVPKNIKNLFGFLSVYLHIW